MLRSVNYWNSIRFTVESRIYLSFYINYLWFYYFTLEHQPHGPSLWHKLKLWDSGGSWRTALSRRGQKSISIRLGCAWLCESERGGRATGDGRRATGDGRRATGDGRGRLRRLCARDSTRCWQETDTRTDTNRWWALSKVCNRACVRTYVTESRVYVYSSARMLLIRHFFFIYCTRYMHLE